MQEREPKNKERESERERRKEKNETETPPRDENEKYMSKVYNVFLFWVTSFFYPYVDSIALQPPGS